MEHAKCRGATALLQSTLIVHTRAAILNSSAPSNTNNCTHARTVRASYRAACAAAALRSSSAHFARNCAMSDASTAAASEAKRSRMLRGER